MTEKCRGKKLALLAGVVAFVIGGLLILVPGSREGICVLYYRWEYRSNPDALLELKALPEDPLKVRALTHFLATKRGCAWWGAHWRKEVIERGRRSIVDGLGPEYDVGQFKLIVYNHTPLGRARFFAEVLRQRELVFLVDWARPGEAANWVNTVTTVPDYPPYARGDSTPFDVLRIFALSRMVHLMPRKFSLDPTLEARVFAGQEARELARVLETSYGIGSRGSPGVEPTNRDSPVRVALWEESEWFLLIERIETSP